MSEISLFGPEQLRAEFSDDVKRQASTGEPESFWGTLTFILMTIAVDC